LDIQVFLTLIIYSAISLILTYYFNLFVSKDEYTRQEISDVFPQVGNMLRKISSNYPVMTLSAVTILSAFSAILLLIIFKNWIINSAAIPLLVFFIGPKLAVYFEETRVSVSDRFTDVLETIYSRFFRYIIAGFLAGFGTKLIDNWINIGSISFYWFLINFIINTGLLVLILREDIFEQ